MATDANIDLGSPTEEIKAVPSSEAGEAVLAGIQKLNTRARLPIVGLELEAEREGSHRSFFRDAEATKRFANSIISRNLIKLKTNV